MRMPLLPSDISRRAQYLQDRLPQRYMEDFSLLGLVVDRYPEACRLLADHGYHLTEEDGGAEISIDFIRQLQPLMALLAAGRIHCELTDVADTVYQA